MGFQFVGPILLVLLVVTALKGVGINQEYQRAVVYRLGRLAQTKGPGLYWLIPWVDRAVRVDLRTMTVSLPTQETVTKDGVAVKVNATLWHKVCDPILAVNAVLDRDNAVLQAAETSLRDAIGQHQLDDLLKNRLGVNAKLMELLERAAIKWGVEIDAVEVRDLDIPEQMQRAIAREAEASREAKARVIKAEGERAAAAQLVEAARAIGAVPGALELRRLQTITEVGAEQNSTIVIALPEFLGQAGQMLATMKGG
jgi:regulator of protease activity HflC (stomatin/prohibitin superfamily)